jgi:ABC-2 type transport system permease protein
MRPEIFFKVLRDRRRSLVGWSLGVLGIVAMYVSLWPTIKDQATDFQKLIENYPEALKSIFGIEEITTPAGYLNTELFSFMAPLIFIAFAIGMATDATAGEEEAKTIDLLMANPVTRTRVVTEKFVALMAGLGVVGGVLAVSLLLGGWLVGLGIGVGRVMAAVVDQFLLGVSFGSIALAIACVTGRRGLSRGVASAVAVAAFLVSTLAPLADWLEPYREVSPMYHATATEPLRNGLSMAGIAYLLAIAAVFFVGSLVAFNRRDLAT